MSSKYGSDTFLEGLQEQIEHWRMFAEGDRWLLAVSGGCDSMALLYGLIKLQNDGILPLEQVHIGHLNHCLRGQDSDEDAEFVKQQANCLAIGVTVGVIDIENVSRETCQSIELAARQQRYRFLIRTARRQRCNKIVMAHHADDNLETILQRILRGTGIRGLAGIPARRTLSVAGEGNPLELIRPMLTVRRHEIETFLQKENIAYRQDSSNFSRKYTRNRIRHDLLPLLRSRFNPEVDEALLRLGTIARDMSTILTQDIDAKMAELLSERSENHVALQRNQLTGLNRLMQAEVIHHALQLLSIPLHRIGFKQIQAVLELAASQAKHTLELPAGLRVYIHAEALIFDRTVKRKIHHDNICCSLLPEGITTIEQPVGWYEIGTRKFNIIRQVKIQRLPASDYLLTRISAEHQPDKEIIDSRKLRGRLYLRNRRPGDRFWPLGAPGAKKLGDFLTDCKVPLSCRDQIGLLCDDAGIVWVMGLRISQHVKIDSTSTELLSLHIE